jgi:hypothetical protein
MSDNHASLSAFYPDFSATALGEASRKAKNRQDIAEGTAIIAWLKNLKDKADEAANKGRNEAVVEKQAFNVMMHEVETDCGKIDCNPSMMKKLIKELQRRGFTVTWFDQLVQLTIRW